MNRSSMLSVLVSVVACLLTLDMKVVAADGNTSSSYVNTTVDNIAVKPIALKELIRSRVPVPTPSRIPAPVPLRILQSLSKPGDNGSPSNAFPLGLCEGDCDRDRDCQRGLKCFHRSGTQSVPGCVGSGQSGKDYCFKPGSSNPPNPSPSGGLIYKGDNGRPSRAFPLGRCEGDCDNDNQCRGSLRCFQRRGTEGVPGCGSGGHAGKDYCYDGGGEPSPPSPNPAPSPSSGSFKLRLYWQKGYFWQERTKEWFYCMVCTGGCGTGSRIKIDKCRSSNTRWQFVHPSGRGSQIRMSGSNKCIERTGATAISLQTCDSGDSKQRWEARLGSFNGKRFDIRPTSDSRKCLSQHHHPKPGELVYAETCNKAHGHTTGYWNKY